MHSDRPSRPRIQPATPAVEAFLPAPESRRPLRWALLVAAIFHLALLWIPLRYTVEAAPDPESPKVFVVQPTPFKPPPVDPVPEIPRQRSRLVPVPDLTPHDPEPIRPQRELPTSLDLPLVDFAVAIPDAPPPPPPDGPLRIGGSVSRPIKTVGPIPLYPEGARRVRFECTVILHTVIDTTGRVTEIEPLKTCPLGMTEAAEAAVGEWRYEPALRGGIPVPVYMDVTVEFSLQ